MNTKFLPLTALLVLAVIVVIIAVPKLNEPTPESITVSPVERCALRADNITADFKCYNLDNYSLIYPATWQTPGQGDAGTFLNGDVAAYLDDRPIEFMAAEDLAYLNTAGPEKWIMQYHQNFCGQTDACPELIDQTPVTMAGITTDLYHYQFPGLALDNSNGHIDEYVMGLFTGDIYYQWRLWVPSTVSAAEATERYQEFLQMAESLSVK